MKFVNGVIAFAALGMVTLAAAPAQAQATRTWVSGIGDDANPCSRTAPCKTFAGAISKTATNGEINCLDPGGFGAVTITKSIIISCEIGTAGVLASGTNGIVVNTPASSIVYLRGLDIQGVTTGLSGISFIGAGVLHVEKSIIRQFNSGAARGISFTPNGTAELSVADTVLAENGAAGSGGNIVVAPTAGAAANVSLLRVQMINGTAGLTADATGGGLNVTVTQSIAAQNSATGFVATKSAGASGVNFTLNRSTAASNGTVGVQANGSPINMFIGDSVVVSNGTGVQGLNAANLRSYQNNQINFNGSDGTPVTAVSLQ